jgi:hypothetical protein
MKTRTVDSDTWSTPRRPRDAVLWPSADNNESDKSDERRGTLCALWLVVEALTDSMQEAGRNAGLVWAIWRDCFATWGEFHAVAESQRIGYPKAIEVGQKICDALNRLNLDAPVDDETMRDLSARFAAALGPVFEHTRKEPIRVLRILSGVVLKCKSLDEVCREYGIQPTQGKRVLDRIKDALPSIRMKYRRPNELQPECEDFP